MAPSKQACKNNEKFSYSGKEMSPLGLGYCADAEPVGSFMEGKDGKTWIVGVKNNEKVWIRAPENKQLEKEEPIEIQPTGSESETEKQEVKPKKSAPKKKQAKPAKETEADAEPAKETEADAKPTEETEVDAKPAEEVEADAKPTEKPKRKYTKKTKEAKPTVEVDAEPAEEAEKPKRKYTKKTKEATPETEGAQGAEKPKRKYTKKTKQVTEEEQLPAKPKTKRGPSGYNLYIGMKINEFRASEQGLKTTEYMKKAQDAWRALSKTEQDDISKELKEAAVRMAVVEVEA